MGQALRDQVRDRLTFTRAGWTDDHEIASVRCRHDGGQLRRVRRQRMNDLLGPIALIQLPRRRHGSVRQVSKRLALLVDQMAHHAVAFECSHAFGQIFPHQILGERKRGQHRLLNHLHASQVADRVSNHIEQPRNIDSVFIRGQTVDQRGEIDSQIPLQLFHQRRIESRLVVRFRQSERRAGGPLRQLDGQQQQRSAERSRIIERLAPAQKTDRQVQRVRAALRLVVGDFAAERRKPLEEFVAAERA